MIIQELAYKVTVKADEFLNGKRKVSEEVGKLNKELSRAEKEREKELKKQREELEKFGKSATSAFRNVTAAAAGFLGIGAGLYGIKQLFTSTANEIVRASTQAKFFGSDVNRLFGMRRGFEQAGLNADAFIGASGNARMALANIKDPTIFGGLTGAAQNLMVLGARTGLNINNLGDPNKALGEFTRYGKSHSQENLMQVMAAAGFDPTDAAKIKSGELKSLVDSETKKSNITAAQVKEQENLLVTLGQLDAQFDRIRQDIAIAFAPEVMSALKQFGDWIKDHHGDIIGFFRDAGESVKKLTESVGGANALLLLLAAGLRLNPLVLAGMAGVQAINNIADAAKEKDKTDSLWNSIVKRWNAGGWANATGVTSNGAEQHAQSARRMQQSPGEMDDLLHGVMMTESGGNPLAYNVSGATGAYQLMRGTAMDMGLRVDSQVDERLDPEKSRAAAGAYMRVLLKRYDGNVDNALRAYNWGMGNVDKWIANGSDISQLPKETREYTGKVYGNIGNARNYYATQGRMADNRPYQLASSGGQPQIQNSTHINTVNVNSNPTTVDALTKSINQQASRASTNAAFSSIVR
ncbi:MULTISPECIES: lytic transglycosylase domain-containing protein [unclassified Citrobacter]|uniref:lytic transglycosylase domain-containing protein n=1 Tax=unclassified Citrobacter TaxID=2644389 RepID=UPI001B37604C|nr:MULTISPECIES: lytic transglycosylase domain-containing protein [unclassified Citrobacter]MBP8542015.1 transglycosylase SLT domain-containing protein [Citrobacter sp. On2M]MBP8543477.1 transglycosylase SLT domain-containing protein [Citrobacter sp. On2M]MBW5274222.1 transglycosylase SLT domain-containing protein [Citrobacter sp. On28M]